MTARRSALLLAALPALLVLCLELPALVQGRHFFLRDVLNFSWPEKLWTAQALSAGHIPLWDPRVAGGVPHLAYLTYGVLDPLNVLLVLFPLPRALDLLIVGHVLLAAVLAAGLGRCAGLTPLAAALSGGLYALGGSLQGITINLPYLGSAAWLCGALWALERLARAPGARAAGLFALAVLLTFVAGDPQLVFFLLLFAPIRLALAGRSRVAPRFAWAALGVGLFAAASLVLFLPSMELLERSDRSGGIALEQAQYWSLHPVRLVELMVSLPFDSPAPDGRWWGHFLENYPNREPWAASLYQGGPAVLLALFGLVSLIRGPLAGPTRMFGVFLLLTGIAGLLVAFGVHLPIYAALHAHLPGFSRFRYPAKTFLWCSLALAFLAGLGLDSLTLGRRFRAMAVIASLSLISGLSLVVAAATTLPAQVVAAAVRAGAIFPVGTANDIAQRLGVRLGVSGAAFILAGIAVAMLAARTRSGASAQTSGLMVALVLLIDVLLVANNLSAWTDDTLYARRPPAAATIAALLTEPRDQRVLFVPEFSDFAGEIAPIGMGRELTRMEIVRLADVANLSPNLAAAWGFRTQGGFLPARPRDGMAWWRRALRSGDPLLATRAIQLTSTAVVVATPAAAPGMAQLPALVAESEARGFAPGAGLFRVAGSLPRAYVAVSAEGVANMSAAQDAIARPGFRPLLDVAIEGTVPAAALRDGAADGAAGSARIVSDDGDQMWIEAEVAQGGGWLVVTDSWDPGWTARCNGAEVAVSRANGIGRAIPVPAGPVRVEFRYRPGSLYRALPVSLAALALIVLLIALGREARPTAGHDV